MLLIGSFHEGFAIKRQYIFKKSFDVGHIFIDKKLNPQTEEYFEDAQNFSEGYAAIKYNGKWGFINSKFNNFLDIKFVNVQPFNQGLAPVKSYKWGYMNKFNEMVIKPKYDSCTIFRNGLAYVWINDNDYRVEGYINIKGDFIWHKENH